MKHLRKTAILVGLFFLLSNITFLLGAFFFVEPYIAMPIVPWQILANGSKITLGALLEMVNGVFYIGIAVLMYPLLKKQNESLALAYVIFRIVEFIMQIGSDVSALGILQASRMVWTPGMETVFISFRFWFSQMISLTFGLGAMIFYILLIKSKQLPRFISIWGLVGAILVTVSTVTAMFNLTFDFLGFIMLANEIFLGFWLIFKGFKPTAEPQYAN